MSENENLDEVIEQTSQAAGSAQAVADPSQSGESQSAGEATGSEGPTQADESNEAPAQKDVLDSRFANFDAILAPIAGDNPCGDGRTARYETDYEELEAEVAKMVSLTASNDVDWGKIKRLSESYLSQYAIDLLVASYFCYGLYTLEGYQGVNAGLAAMNKLIDQYWDGMFPPLKRMGGRAAAVQWLIDRLEKGFAERQATSGEIKVLEATVEQISTLAEKLDGLMADKSPDWGAAKRVVQQYLTNLKQAQREAERKRQQQDQKSAASSGGTSAGTGGLDVPLEIQSDGDVRKALRGVEKMFITIADFYRNQNLQDPQSFHFTRYAAWTSVTGAPKTSEGVTGIEAPEKDSIERWESKFNDGSFKDLVTLLEKSLPRNRFWLRSQFLLSQALERLGPGYDRCKQAVHSHLAALVARVPEIYDLHFSNRKPFVDEETRNWIESTVTVGGGGGGPALSGDGDDAPWLEAAGKAKALAAEGKFAEGLQVFRECAQTGSKRENFIWRIYQSHYTLDAGQLELAIGQLEALDRESQAFGLDEWEPKLSVEVARQLLLCYANYLKKTKKSMPELKEKMEDLYRRICRLDINTALSIEEKPWQA